MLETCVTELRSQDEAIRALRETLANDELARREEASRQLLLDAARKAEATRDKERVKRIGLILAHTIVQDKTINSDEAEEMMRVAMEISDRDAEFLRELVRIEGPIVAAQGRVDRYSAHTDWERGSWGTLPDPEIDSVFSKLESYGLVARIPPPNSLNILADFQNRYVLLRKGLRFVDFARRHK